MSSARRAAILGLPAPATPRGIATTCASASAVIAAGVMPLVATLYGADLPIKSLIVSPIAIILGGYLHYVAACGAVGARRRKKR